MPQKYTITDKVSDNQFLCYEDESLYAGMRRTQRGHIRYGCGGGGCGVCKIKILEGEFFPFKNMSAEKVTEEDIKNNVVLACCVKPRSNLTLSKAE